MRHIFLCLFPASLGIAPLALALLGMPALFAAAQVDPSAEIQVSEIPIEPMKKNPKRSRFSIVPGAPVSDSSVPDLSAKKSKQTDPVSTDVLVESDPDGSILTPPPLTQSVATRPVATRPVATRPVATQPAASQPINQVGATLPTSEPAEPVTPKKQPAPPRMMRKRTPPKEQTVASQVEPALPIKGATSSAKATRAAPMIIKPEGTIPASIEPVTEVAEPGLTESATGAPVAGPALSDSIDAKRIVAGATTISEPVKAAPTHELEELTPKKKAAEPKKPEAPKKETPAERRRAARRKQASKDTPLSKDARISKNTAPVKPAMPLPEVFEELPKQQIQELPHVPSMADADVTPEEQAFIEKGIDTTLAQKQEKEQAHKSFEKLAQKGTIYLGQYMEPWKGTDPKETVEMNFDNKELTELLKFLSNNLDVTFILDDYIEPARADGLQPLAGTRISFKSNAPLTLKQAWEIGLTFLEMAGFSVIPATQPRMYRVTTSASRDKPSANREPLPTFIGTDPELLPDNDTKIRYVYFADNAELSTITQIIDAMKSGSSGPLIEVPQLKAVILTDKAANIKSLIRILQEIDAVTLPETLAVIRLRHTDARTVRELYYKLIGKDTNAPMFNPFARQRKSSTTQYFTEATRVFEEPRTNSLIVLGTRENIKRFEDFIIKYVDKTLDLPFSPLHVIQLKYMDAASIAKILNDTIQKFNSDPANTAAALVGGVRDSNKFFRPSVRITEEPSGNRLIINADYEEYLKLREIIEKLDVEQPQVAIKVLILNVDLSNTETLGTQLRNKVDCCDRTGGLDTILGTNVNFQTNFLGYVVTNEPAPGAPAINGAERLLGNLLNLANSVGGVSPFGVGTTLVTLGQDMFGFWGLLRALETYTRVSVVANPFLVTTHKYKAEISVGETRRTTTATVEGQQTAQAQGDIAANLRVIITPQISYDDMVTLNVYVELTQFTTTDPNNANRLIRKVSTEALLANKEVLALGGLLQDTKNEVIYKVPFLGDIPLIGWLFKNKSTYIDRTSLLILIAPEIIKPHEPEAAEEFTFGKLNEAKDTLFKMRNAAERRDPIHRWMFNDHKNKEVATIDKFVARQQRYIDPSQKKSEVVALHKAPKPQGARA